MFPTSPLAATAGFTNPDRPAAAPRRRYPSDLTDAQWATIAPLIPPDSPMTRRKIPLRDILDALNYRWETGCSWRMLPHDYPKWQTVYMYLRMWRLQGVLRPIREAVVRGK